MGNSIIYSPRAGQDLRDIWNFIAADSVDRADDFIGRISQRFEQLIAFPRSGRTRDDLGPGVRTLPVGNFLVIFRPTEQGVDIVRVLHGARDIPSLMDDSDPAA